MKLKIEVSRNTSLIDQVLGESGLNKVEQKFYGAIYKSKQVALFNLIKRRLKSYCLEEEKERILTTEEGEEDYINKEKEKFENFVFGDESELNKSPDYAQFKNDRFINKVMRSIKRGAYKSKNYAITKALGKGKVMDFFMRFGIHIKWWVE
jgi:hypothetical protein